MNKKNLIISLFAIIASGLMFSSCNSGSSSGGGDVYSTFIGKNDGDFRSVTLWKTTYSDVKSQEDESAIYFPSDSHEMLSYNYIINDDDNFEIYYYFNDDDVCTNLSATFRTREKDNKKNAEAVDNLFNKLKEMFTKKYGEGKEVSEFIHSWEFDSKTGNKSKLDLSRTKNNGDGQVSIVISSI